MHWVGRGGIDQRMPRSDPGRLTTGPIQRRNILGGILHDYYRGPSSLASGLDDIFAPYNPHTSYFRHWLESACKHSLFRTGPGVWQVNNLARFFNFLQRGKRIFDQNSLHRCRPRRPPLRAIRITHVNGAGRQHAFGVRPEIVQCHSRNIGLFNLTRDQSHGPIAEPSGRVQYG